MALCMALKSLGTDVQVEEAMAKARELKFTKQGELFDSEFMFQDFHFLTGTVEILTWR